jgi:hypothetical protein
LNPPSKNSKKKRFLREKANDRTHDDGVVQCIEFVLVLKRGSWGPEHAVLSPEDLDMQDQVGGMVVWGGMEGVFCGGSDERCEEGRWRGGRRSEGDVREMWKEVLGRDCRKWRETWKEV